jgi:hypothetical protein
VQFEQILFGIVDPSHLVFLRRHASQALSIRRLFDITGRDWCEVAGIEVADSLDEQSSTLMAGFKHPGVEMLELLVCINAANFECS